MNARALALALSMAVLASGCTLLDDMEDGRRRVRYFLKDGSSAEFRNERTLVHEGRDIYCGEVNSKNDYGAYGGFTRYVVYGNAVVFEGDNEPSYYPYDEKDRAERSSMEFHDRSTMGLATSGAEISRLRERNQALQKGVSVPQAEPGDHAAHLFALLTRRYCTERRD